MKCTTLKMFVKSKIDLKKSDVPMFDEFVQY